MNNLNPTNEKTVSFLMKNGFLKKRKYFFVKFLVYILNLVFLIPFNFTKKKLKYR
jgi:hypothetical protein